jgi:hypothetical protein
LWQSSCPDGFNGKFLKTCWPTNKNDFVKLVNDIYSGELNQDSINYAFVTLIPKVNDREAMNDFRLILLVSLPLKFLTKLHANRLQKEVIPIIPKNQYGFIKGKTIHDCIGWAFEYINICHQSKNPIVIFKIFFEKLPPTKWNTLH